MCLICAELKQDKLTALEARRNLGELYTKMKKDHIYEVLRLIWNKEDEEYIHWYEDNRYGDSD